MRYIYLSIAIIAEAVATNALKACQQFTRFWPSVLVIVAYASTFYFLSIALKTIPVAVANAIWAGTSIVLVALGARIFFKQQLDLAAIIGMALVIAGVLVMALCSKTAG